MTNGTDGMLAFPSPAPLPGLVTLDTDRATYLYVLTVVAVLVGIMLLVLRVTGRRDCCAPRGTARPGCGPAGIPSPDTSPSPTWPRVASPGRRAHCWSPSNGTSRPGAGGFDISALVLLAVVIGGATSLIGALLGAGLVVATRDWLAVRRAAGRARAAGARRPVHHLRVPPAPWPARKAVGT